MKLHGLPPSLNRSRTRRGRGESSGLGKTSGRGSNGARSRAGYHASPVTSGIPWYRKLPMRGFTGADPKKRRAEVTLRRLLPLLAEIVGTAQIDRKFLIEKGLLRSCAREFKVIGDVQLPRALSIRANSFSAGARHAIQNAGGEAILLTAAQPEEVKRP